MTMLMPANLASKVTSVLPNLHIDHNQVNESIDIDWEKSFVDKRWMWGYRDTYGKTMLIPE